MQGFGIGNCFGSGAHFGFGHYFQQRRAGAVQVDAGGAVQAFMHRFARVFFHMGAGYVDGFDVVADHDFQLAVLHNRQVQLADLVAFGQVGIEIVLAIKHVFLVDLGIQRQAELNRFFHHFAVHHRQRAGQRAFHHASMRVRLGAEGGTRAAENFGFGVELDVDFQSDYGFPGHVFVFLI